MEISWSGAESSKTYVSMIRAEVLDRIGIIKDVLTKIADNKTNVTYANVKSKNKRVAIVELALEIADIDHLNKVIASIQSMSDVLLVRRQQSGGTSRYI